MKPQTSIKLRWHLVVLIVATLVPMLIFAAILMQREIKQQQESVDRGMRHTARALSLAVDREISSARAVLDTLEGSQSIDERNFQRFYRVGCGRRGETSRFACHSFRSRRSTAGQHR